MTEPTIIAPSFAGQLRVAADDPSTTPGTMREAMRSAASALDAHVDLIHTQQQWIDQLKLRTGAANALAITALVLASVAIWMTL